MRIEKGKILDGRYQLVRTLKSGLQSQVWLATADGSPRQVAVKILHPDFVHADIPLKRFMREIAIVSRFKHPYICELLDSGEDEAGLFYFVMPLLIGATLAERQKEKCLSTDRILEIISQTLKALEAAHKRGVIHRDIKPSNIFVTRAVPGLSDGNIRLIDFGISKLLDDKMSLTAAGISLGTIHYMSPEQLSGVRVDHRADLYSVGVVLYEMLTGQKPHIGDTPEAERLNIDNALWFEMPRCLNPRISPALEAVIVKAMSRDPAMRYRSASEMRQALEAATAKRLPDTAYHSSTKETLEFASGKIVCDRSSWGMDKK